MSCKTLQKCNHWCWKVSCCVCVMVSRMPFVAWKMSTSMTFSTWPDQRTRKLRLKRKHFTSRWESSSTANPGVISVSHQLISVLVIYRKCSGVWESNVDPHLAFLPKRSLTSTRRMARKLRMPRSERGGWKIRLRFKNHWEKSSQTARCLASGEHWRVRDHMGPLMLALMRSF